MSTKRIIRRHAVEDRTGLKHSAIYDRLNPKSKYFDPTFPKPVPLGAGRAVGWLEHEIEAWIDSRIQQRESRT